MESCNESYLLSFVACAVVFFLLGRFSTQIQDRIRAYLPVPTSKGEEYATLGDSGIADTESGQQLYRPSAPQNWGSQLSSR